MRDKFAIRLSQLCAIMDDPQVPGGAVIQLSNLRSPSRIDQVAEARVALELPPMQPSSEDSALALLRSATSIIAEGHHG